MKVITAKEMAQTESEAFANGASDAQFMIAAGKGIAEKLEKDINDYNLPKLITLLCAKGNNSGDAYVAGTILLKKGFAVEALQLTPIDGSSPLCQEHYHKYTESGGSIHFLKENEEIPLPQSGVFLDGIFGTGFHGEAKALFATLIDAVNKSNLPIYAIDIPSGLNGNNGKVKGSAIKATTTLFLGLPKSGFFLNEGWNHVGDLFPIDFGLGKKEIETAHEEFVMITEEAGKLCPPIIRNRNKYSAGYVIGIAGSPGMPGAAILSSWAALRGGAGILTLFHPQEMQQEFNNCPHEIIRAPYQLNDDHSHEVMKRINRCSACFIGPGIGRPEKAKPFFTKIFSNIKAPLVIDADALNIIAEEDLPIPPNSILTPHSKEMHRLLKLKEVQPLSKEFLEKCRTFSDKHQITLILKSTPAFIIHPGEAILVNPFGSPGMATAGSGDVLTGLLAALLAQGLTPFDAAHFGVFLHAKAGEAAAKKLTPYCMVASDITEMFPTVFSNYTKHTSNKIPN